MLIKRLLRLAAMFSKVFYTIKGSKPAMLFQIFRNCIWVGAEVVVVEVEEEMGRHLRLRFLTPPMSTQPPQEDCLEVLAMVIQ